jgi:hypothetical protein
MKLPANHVIWEKAFREVTETIIATGYHVMQT